MIKSLGIAALLRKRPETCPVALTIGGVSRCIAAQLLSGLRALSEVGGINREGELTLRLLAFGLDIVTDTELVLEKLTNKTAKTKKV